MSVKINLGMEVRDFVHGGMVEDVSLRSFKGNVLISGGARSERTALLSHVLNQFYTRVPEIGVLLIQLGSSEETYLYHLDKVYQYGAPELIIPYFTGEQFNDVNSHHFSRYINAVFGFHFEMRIITSILCRNYRKGRLPSSIVDFLEDLERCLRNHPYDEEFNESNIKSFEKAVEIFQEDPILERTLSIPLELPEWLNFWSRGGKICMDLSKCSIEQQKLLVMMIVQAIHNYVDHNNSSDPTGIVVIEDADTVLEKPPNEEYRKNYEKNKDYSKRIEEENYFLTKEQIEEVFEDNNYLRNVQLEHVYYDLIGDEYRYRNISLITVCEDPAKIYDFVSSRSQIKLQMS